MVYKLVFTLIVSLSLQVFAKDDCFISQAMNDKALVSNQSFWAEFSTLMDKGLLDQKAFQHLTQKYKGENLPSSHLPQTHTTRAPAFSRMSVETSKKADKDIAKLPKELLTKYQEFMTVVLSPDGVQGFYKNPGRWHIEKLTGKSSYTVKLNKGVRVQFLVEDGKVHVLQVNADHVHDHLNHKL